MKAAALPSIRSRIVEFLPAVPARDLVPDARNWRRHPKAQQDALRGLLTEIGYADALLARRTPDGLKLVDGHLRASLDPAQSVPVLVLDLDEHEAGKLLLTLDPLAAMAQADGDALVKLLDEERFTDAGVNAMLEALANGEKLPMPGLHGLTDDDAVPDDAPTTCKPGDLWILGYHRLLCGDSTVITDVEKLMQGDKAGLLLTDPPYAVEYVEKARDMNERGYGHSRATLSAAIKGDGLNDETAAILWRDSFTTAVAAALNDTPAIYIWHAPGRAMLVLHAVLSELGFLYHQTLIWHKNNFVIGRCDYQYQHEPCYYGWIQGHRPPFYGPKNQTTVWDIARDTNKPVHPTQKPVAVLTPAIQNHLKSGEVAYDPFGGSGSTLIACEKLGRKCRMLEIDPHYCDVIIRRWEDFTGRKAVRA